MIKLRKTKIRGQQPKAKTRLTGGPFDGRDVWLTTGDTMGFHMGRHRGQYVNGRWQNSAAVMQRRAA